MSDWNPQELALLVGSTGAAYADYSTTRKFLEEGDYELNPLLGEHPSKSRLKNYFLGSALAKAALAHSMPKYRKGLLAGFTGVNAMLAHQNKKGDRFDSASKLMKKPALAGLAAGLLAHHFLNDEESGVSVGPGALGPMSIAVQKKF